MSFGSTVVRPSLTAVALVLLFVVGACAQPAPPPDAAQPTAELARFYGQELRFGPCAGYATTGADEKLFAGDPRFECARLEVPLDYDKPAGETAQVAVLRVPARGASMGSLLLNSGGPGGTGMNFAAVLASTLAQSPVTERFDLIGFDPRGVGATTPAVDCYSDEQVRADQAPQNEFLISAGTLTEDGARQLVQTCAERSGGEQALAAIGTRDTVRDMDVLRGALGEEQLNFFGQSYGTRVGAFYAAEYPQRVRAMVLDGAVDPRHGTRRPAALPVGRLPAVLRADGHRLRHSPGLPARPRPDPGDPGLPGHRPPPARPAAVHRWRARAHLQHGGRRRHQRALLLRGLADDHPGTYRAARRPIRHSRPVVGAVLRTGRRRPPEQLRRSRLRHRVHGRGAS